MPLRLPIFPLSVVLFPGTPLPLHIFEPRYRQMLADCVAGDRRFGITPTGKDDGMPDPGTVGCIAEVRVNQELPDGRSNIIVFGGERFMLTGAGGRATPTSSRSWTPSRTRRRTRRRTSTPGACASCSPLLRAARHANDVEPEDPQPARPIALDLSFQIAATLDTDPEVKQRLLGVRSTARRVQALLHADPDSRGGRRVRAPRAPAREQQRQRWRAAGRDHEP